MGWMMLDYIDELLLQLGVAIGAGCATHRSRICELARLNSGQGTRFISPDSSEQHFD